MAARARDCVPLDVPLVIEDLNTLGEDALRNAAASLRGKGFTVLGSVKDAINQWASARSSPASVDVVWSPEAPPGPILDVGDPGARVEGEAVRIPIEKLWARIDELRSFERVVIAAGYGVRAALAVGLLERFGTPDIVFWRSARVRRRALTG